MYKPAEAKSILNKTKSRDSWFLDDYTINPYSACGYNCLFCYIRGSKYGEHMESSLRVKSNAPELLEKQLALRAKKGQFGFIVMSSATEPYQKAEEKLGLTRQLLEIILKYRFPIHIITRSKLVLRDLDLLKAIHEQAILPPDLQKLGGGTILTFSFSTMRDEVAKIFEPGACPPSLRLETLQEVSAQGFRTGVSLMPLLPYISDTTDELEFTFETLQRSGAKFIMPSTITLFGHDKPDSRTLIFNAVRKHYPHLLPKYEKYLGQSDYMPQFYFTAFQKKMQELSEKYDIPLRIV